MEAARKIVGPGIYRRGDVDYDAIDAVNYSTLKEFARSPKHYAHRLKTPRVETKSMFRGSAAHTAILEPEEFERRYVVFDGKTRRGKKWDAFLAENGAQAILKASEYAVAMAFRDAVRGDPVAQPYLVGGERELTLVWIDPETGVKCKGRLDYVTRDGDIIDVKTTKDASPFWFSRDAAKYKYHVQGALYGDGYEVLTGHTPTMRLIAVEAAEPRDVVVYRMGDPVLGPGRDAYRKWLKTMLECRQEKRWPGYSNGFEVELTLPPWELPDEGDIESLGLEM